MRIAGYGVTNGVVGEEIVEIKRRRTHLQAKFC